MLWFQFYFYFIVQEELDFAWIICFLSCVFCFCRRWERCEGEIIYCRKLGIFKNKWVTKVSLNTISLISYLCRRRERHVIMIIYFIRRGPFFTYLFLLVLRSLKFHLNILGRMRWFVTSLNINREILFCLMVLVYIYRRAETLYSNWK